PPTRVAASASGAKGGRGTLPYVIGAAVAAVLAIGAVLTMRRRDPIPVVTPPDTTVASPSPSTNVPPVAIRPETTATSTPGVRPADTAATPLGHPLPPVKQDSGVRAPTQTPPPVVTPTVNYGAILDSIEKALDPGTSSSSDARSAIPILARIMPHLTAKNERVRAQLLRVEALMLSGQGERACPVLASITGNISDGQRKRIDLYRTTLKCP
ncbi:MAG: hypothetical protein M3081_07105, partial [Gemmatimonadota bacterium]|nr:hypothetical protein [Gemmatimonadota bacterium]